MQFLILSWERERLTRMSIHSIRGAMFKVDETATKWQKLHLFDIDSALAANQWIVSISLAIPSLSFFVSRSLINIVSIFVCIHTKASSHIIKVVVGGRESIYVSASKLLKLWVEEKAPCCTAGKPCNFDCRTL